MPVVVSNEGWVKVASKQPKMPPKPINPVNVLRGPLAYITGRPELKEPVKKQSIQQLLLDTAIAAPPPPPLQSTAFQEKSKRSRTRTPSTPHLAKSFRKPPIELFEEADEEIVRPDLRRELGADDSQSRRSASPVASRRSSAAPSTRSRRHESTHTVRDEENGRRSRRSKQYDYPDSIYENDTNKHHHARRHFSASSSHYYDDEPRRHHRSERGERSYRDHSRDRYHSRAYSYNNAYPMPMPMPQIQPIVIYPSQSTGIGCGSHHHGCHSQVCHQHQCSTKTQSMIEASIPTPIESLVPDQPSAFTSALDRITAPAALPAPRATPSEVSSASGRSATSRTMSYKWYTATQPLIL